MEVALKRLGHRRTHRREAWFDIVIPPSLDWEQCSISISAQRRVQTNSLEGVSFEIMRVSSLHLYLDFDCNVTRACAFEPLL